MRFNCVCGQTIYFENTRCVTCNRELAFSPSRLDMVALESDGGGGHLVSGSSDRVRKCPNYEVQNVCNWIIDSDDFDAYCRACRLNQVIPDLGEPNHRLYWSRLETAKRRALYTIIRLGLPIVGRQQDMMGGLAFAFMADRESESEFHATGHANGLVTINVSEADELERTRQRFLFEERYRTLLGHFRHEIGHYYWNRLVANDPRVVRFRAIFGDERENYDASISIHYQSGPRPNWETEFVSPYASSHPWEDWAECWAHYMHIVDAVETAGSFGLIPSLPLVDADPQSFKALVDTWIPLSVAQNAMNRSLGLNDAYPFVLSSEVIEKLRFVHETIFPPRLT